MIGVPALIRLHEYYARCLFPQTSKNVLGQRYEIETSLLVGDTDEFGPDTVRSPGLKRRMQLDPTGKRIVGDVAKAACRCIPPVARRAVSDLQQQGIAESAQ